MTERNYNYDLMRILACFMIICMHAPMPSDKANSLFLNAVGYFSAPGLCLFFVLSGALLLPVKIDTFEFLKKRLGKIIMPTLFFTGVYLAIKVFVGEEGLDLKKSIFSIPFSAQGHGVLWFMYTLIGLYLLSPILSKWLSSASKREIEFYLLLWIITMCYPLFGLFLDIQAGETGILYYFSGYAGYFLLGYYLKTYSQSITIQKMIIPCCVSVAAPVFYKLEHLEIDFYSLFWYLSIFVAILTVCFYKVFTIKSLKIDSHSSTSKLIINTSGLTFGIYLIHIALMRNIVWNLHFIKNIHNYYMQWFCIVIITFVLSWSVTYFISLLPIGNYIVGYKSKK